jgi:hypothetical protein
MLQFRESRVGLLGEAAGRKGFQTVRLAGISRSSQVIFVSIFDRNERPDDA